MARPRTIVVTNNADARYIEDMSRSLREDTDQDVVIMDGNALGDSDVIIQSGASESSGRDPVANTLLAAVIGGIGATVGEIIIEQTLADST